MGLVFRINLLITVLLLALLSIALVQTVYSVREEVFAEVRNDTAASLELISAVVTDESVSEHSKRQLIVRLVSIVGAEQVAVEHRTALQQFVFRARAKPGEFDGVSPAWFNRLLSPPEPPEFMHIIPESSQGRVIVMINPARKIDEVWRTIKPILTVLGGFILLSYALVYYSVRTALKPVSNIVSGLEQMARGDFKHRLAPSGLPELRTVSHRINALAEQLEDSEATENRLRLAAIQAQEAERRYLAAELHDEFGQSLTAIKALAVADRRAANTPTPISTKPALPAEVTPAPNNVNRRQSIERLCDHLHGVLRNMMRQLRPVVLDEFGLTQAVQQLVDDWNEVDDSVFCSLSVRGDFSHCSDALVLVIYRTIQECLTNTRKHAAAHRSSVTLIYECAAELVVVHYTDDGVGFDNTRSHDGYGLRGVRDRVRAMHGTLQITSTMNEGFAMHAELPATATSAQ